MNRKIKFRVEIVAKGHVDGLPGLSSFDVKYYSGLPDDDHYVYHDVSKLQDDCFGYIAGAITNDYIYSKVSNSKKFVFGTEYYDANEFFHNEHFDEELKNLISAIFDRTFEHKFFYESKLEKGFCYEYIFDLTFRTEVNKSLSVVKLDVSTNKLSEDE